MAAIGVFKRSRRRVNQQKVLRARVFHPRNDLAPVDADQLDGQAAHITLVIALSSAAAI